MTKDEALKLALDKKADNARELGLDYEPENTLHWHALNYRTAPTQNAQAMFEALEKFVEAAIKKALAQPVSSHDNAEDLYVEMSKHLNCPHCGGSGHIDDVAQTQEPVAWMKRINMPGDDWDAYDFSVNQYGDFQTPLYTTPPQHTWVGLTDEEIDVIDEATWDEDHKSWGIHDFARAIEAKLKERNT